MLLLLIQLLLLCSSNVLRRPRVRIRQPLVRRRAGEMLLLLLLLGISHPLRMLLLLLEGLVLLQLLM